MGIGHAFRQGSDITKAEIEPESCQGMDDMGCVSDKGQTRCVKLFREMHQQRIALGFSKQGYPAKLGTDLIL